MRKLLLILLILGIISCKKDEFINPDYCSIGDIWTFDHYDSITAIHSMDSFKFQQALGYHTYYWTSGQFNSISFQVKKITKIDTAPMYYNSTLIHSLKGKYRGKEYTYTPSGDDTVAKISFQNDRYVMNLNPIYVDYEGEKRIMKVCNLIMTDIDPVK